jgi:hypothetical protein
MTVQKSHLENFGSVKQARSQEFSSGGGGVDKLVIPPMPMGLRCDVIMRTVVEL